MRISRGETDLELAVYLSCLNWPLLMQFFSPASFYRAHISAKKKNKWSPIHSNRFTENRPKNLIWWNSLHFCSCNSFKIYDMSNCAEKMHIRLGNRSALFCFRVFIHNKLARWKKKCRFVTIDNPFSFWQIFGRKKNERIQFYLDRLSSRELLFHFIGPLKLQFLHFQGFITFIFPTFFSAGLPNDYDRKIKRAITVENGIFC